MGRTLARAGLGLGLSLAVLAGAPPSLAQPAGDPDWPCVQRKVPALSPAAVWSGPPIEALAGEWRHDAEVSALVERLSQRRLELDEARSEIAAFAASLPPAERERRLTLLFAGLFDTMDAERSTIIAGIGRFARRMRDLAAEIRTAARDLAEARATPGATAATLDERQLALDWQTRIFNERRSTLSYVCDAPRLVEQRLFALGRAIAAELDK